MNKFNITSKNKLDNPERRKQFPPTESLKRLGLREGMDMVDIGTGIGYFSIPATSIVGENNKVYALDTSEKMLEEIRIKVEKNDIRNLITIKSEDYNFKIDRNSADFVLLVNVLHEVDDKIRFIEEIRRISRKNAEIALIDFKGKRLNNQGPPEEIRVSPRDAENLLREAGYKIIELIDFEGSFYGIRAILN